MMSTNFRGEVFKLCKKLKDDNASKQIRDLVYEMSVTKENKKTGEIIKNSHGDFMQLAKSHNYQFMDYLFVDDNADEFKLPAFMSIGHLTSEERLLIESGHRTLMRFIELCLTDISKKSKLIANAISPYFLHKDVNVSAESEAILDDCEYESVVKAFKNGKVYKALINSNISLMFKNIDLNLMRTLMDKMNKDIQRSYCDDLSSDLKRFYKRFSNSVEDGSDIIYEYIMLMHSLKESLAIACQLMYGAIFANNLIVLDNDNLISIEKHNSSYLCSYYKVFVQGAFFNISGSIVGDVILLNCIDSEDRQIHDFGMVISTTVNLIGEYGKTSKILFVIIDAEMNPIHNITNTIIEHGLPKVVKLPK